MPGAIEFVHVAQVGPALIGALPAEIGVQIAVISLRRGDVGDRRIHHLGDAFIRLDGERPRGGFDPFIDVGVVEIQSAEVAVCLARGAAEVRQPPRLFEQAILRWNRDLAIGGQARGPERVVQRHGSQRQRRQGGLATPSVVSTMTLRESSCVIG